LPKTFPGMTLIDRGRAQRRAVLIGMLERPTALVRVGQGWLADAYRAAAILASHAGAR